MILLLNTVFTCILIRDVPDSTFSNPAGSGFEILAQIRPDPDFKSGTSLILITFIILD